MLGIHLNQIAESSIKTKILFFVMYILLLATLNYLLVLNPALKEKDQAKQKIKALNQKNVQQTLLLHKLQDEQKQPLSHHPFPTRALYIESQHLSSWVGFLTQLAQQNHLTLLSSQNLAPIQANFYEELPINLRLLGSYPNLIVFISELTHLTPLFLIADFSLLHDDKKSVGNQLLLIMQLHAFSTNEPKPKQSTPFLSPVIAKTITPTIRDPFSTASITISASQKNKQIITLNFKDVAVRSVLQTLAEFSNVNVIISDKVQGNMSLYLHDTSWEEALHLILQTQGLDQRKIGNSILVAPLPELLAYDKQQLQTKEDLKNAQALQTDTFHLKYGKAQSYYDTLKNSSNTLLSPRGKIMVNPRTNFLFIEDLSDNLKRIRHYINQTDVPLRQVEIEARIVTIDKAYEQQLGIKWNVQGSSAGSSVGNAPRDFNVDLGAAAIEGTPAGNIALATIANDVLIGLELSALEAEGNGEVLSSPRLLTADQQEAVIEQGQEIPYQETASATTGATTTSFKQAVLRLKVTPQIISNNKLLLNLQVNQDAKSRDISKAGVPLIDTRHITTNILINNGETVVLGGIYERNKSDTTTRIPFLSDIPLVGNLFKHRMLRDNRKELLIFVTPRIVSQ